MSERVRCYYTADPDDGPTIHRVAACGSQPWRWRYQYVGEMLRFYRRANEATAAGGKVRLERFGREYDAEGWRRQFRLALDRRINLKIGPPPPWRKMDDDYQRHLANDCRAIRDHATKRVAVDFITTPELRKRFGHIVRRWDGESL